MSLISGLSKFYANSMSALRLIEYHWEKKCLVAFPTIFYANAVRPGFVFIEKLQNNDLTITSFAALRRPNNDIWRFQGWPVSSFGLISQKKYLASKYTMSLNDTLYQSQEISPIFEMSQSESLNHLWWEFPTRGLASLQEVRPPFELPQVSPNGQGRDYGPI